MSRYFELEEELARLLGRRVDLVLKSGIEQSENYIRRREILRTAEPIHAS